VRVSAEWGCGALKSAYARLTVPLPAARSEHRRRIIETCVFMFNVRTRMVGINQIRAVYGSLANTVDDADRVLQYYRLNNRYDGASDA